MTLAASTLPTGSAPRADVQARNHRLRRRCVAAAAVAVLWGTLGCQAERPRRVVLITIDTLRRDALLPEAEGAHPMPLLRDVAQRGTVFTRAFAATASTQPTHASLLTGRHPWQHGVTRNGMVLRENATTLAERFRDAGYATQAIVASFPLAPEFGFAQGFEGYDAAFERRVATDEWGGRPVEENRFYRLASSVTQHALTRLDQLGPVDAFLWLHYFDPHGPYGDTVGPALPLPHLTSLAATADPRLARFLERARELYRIDLASLDRALGRLFQRLDDDAERFETHVALVADHGESFGEGGSLGHGHRLTPAEIAVPLVVLSPRIAPGLRRDVAGSVDVAATLLALAELPAGDIEGRDLVVAPADDDGNTVALGMSRTYAEPFDDWRVDGSKVVLSRPRFYVARADALFVGDARRVVLADDPTREVEGTMAEAPRSMFEAFEASLSAAGASERLDPATQEALRALGYTR